MEQTLGEVMQETIEWFDELMPVEEAKLKAASNYKIVELEECLKKEQAAVLRLKGLDKKREEILSGKGMPGYSFHQVMETAPEEEREELSPIYEELSGRYESYRRLADDIKKVLENGIHKFEKAGGAQIYTKMGTAEQEIRHFTSVKA